MRHLKLSHFVSPDQDLNTLTVVPEGFGLIIIPGQEVSMQSVHNLSPQVQVLHEILKRAIPEPAEHSYRSGSRRTFRVFGVVRSWRYFDKTPALGSKDPESGMFIRYLS